MATGLRCAQSAQVHVLGCKSCCCLYACAQKVAHTHTPHMPHSPASLAAHKPCSPGARHSMRLHHITQLV